MNNLTLTKLPSRMSRFSQSYKYNDLKQIQESHQLNVLSNSN